MIFHSNTGEDVHIGLTSGHAAVVTVEGTELEPRFHKEAIARGCLPAGVADIKTEAKPTFDRRKVIADAMNAMLAGSASDDFTDQGKPNLIKLKARVGFGVAREEADSIWDEVSKAE